MTIKEYKSLSSGDKGKVRLELLIDTLVFLGMASMFAVIALAVSME